MCRVAELNAALYLDSRAKKCKYKFELIFHFPRVRNEPTTSRVYSHTLCAHAPRLVYCGVFYCSFLAVYTMWLLKKMPTVTSFINNKTSALDYYKITKKKQKISKTSQIKIFFFWDPLFRSCNFTCFYIICALSYKSVLEIYFIYFTQKLPPLVT